MTPAGPRRRIAVTGLGAVSPCGWGVEALRSALRAGRTTIGPFERFDHGGQRTHVAAEVPPPADPGPFPRRATWSDRFALAAAREAVGRARLDVGEAAEETGVFFGSSTGGMFEGEAFYEPLLAARTKRPRVSLLEAHQNDSPGNAVARALGLRGPVESVSAACSSAAMALAYALEALRDGEVEVALAGGSDSLCRLTYAGFNSLRSVDARPSRPFRADREGLSLGEGAGVLVLEPLERARARGAEPLAELRGAGLSCDAHHMTAPDPEGRGMTESLGRALADAGLSPDEVDFINAHGTGTPHNDVSEGRAYRQVFGERVARLPVTSTKGLVGHLLGACGALEAIATILDLRDGVVSPTPGEAPADPGLGLDVVTGRLRELPGARVAVSNSLGFGGANASLVLSLPTEAAS